MPTVTSTYGISALNNFGFNINFATGVISGGQLTMTADTHKWSATFAGAPNNAGSSFGPFLSMTVETGAIYLATDAMPTLTSAVSGNIEGYFIGQSAIEGIALGFSLKSIPLGPKHTLAGTVLLSEETSVPDTLSLPDATVDTYDITWGTWANPIEDNWVIVTPQANGSVELETANHLATVNPTPVANLVGSATYGTTAASSFIGSGSAGVVTQVVAGPDVNFNSGAISNGSLQVMVAGSQAWEIDFAGSVSNGVVNLNALGGTLSDPGGLISNSIEANLGGVFTGNNGEAFVGGFDLIDQLNLLNQVDGTFTIEKSTLKSRCSDVSITCLSYLHTGSKKGHAMLHDPRFVSGLVVVRLKAPGINFAPLLYLQRRAFLFRLFLELQ